MKLHDALIWAIQHDPYTVRTRTEALAAVFSSPLLRWEEGELQPDLDRVAEFGDPGQPHREELARTAGAYTQALGSNTPGRAQAAAAWAEQLRIEHEASFARQWAHVLAVAACARPSAARLGTHSLARLADMPFEVRPDWLAGAREMAGIVLEARRAAGAAGPDAALAAVQQFAYNDLARPDGSLDLAWHAQRCLMYPQAPAPLLARLQPVTGAPKRFGKRDAIGRLRRPYFRLTEQQYQELYARLGKSEVLLDGDRQYTVGDADTSAFGSRALMPLGTPI